MNIDDIKAQLAAFGFEAPVTLSLSTGTATPPHPAEDPHTLATPKAAPFADSIWTKVDPGEAYLAQIVLAPDHRWVIEVTANGDEGLYNWAVYESERVNGAWAHWTQYDPVGDGTYDPDDQGVLWDNITALMESKNVKPLAFLTLDLGEPHDSDREIRSTSLRTFPGEPAPEVAGEAGMPPAAIPLEWPDYWADGYEDQRQVRLVFSTGEAWDIFVDPRAREYEFESTIQGRSVHKAKWDEADPDALNKLWAHVGETARDLNLCPAYLAPVASTKLLCPVVGLADHLFRWQPETAPDPLANVEWPDYWQEGYAGKKQVRMVFTNGKAWDIYVDPNVKDWSVYANGASRLSAPNLWDSEDPDALGKLWEAVGKRARAADLLPAYLAVVGAKDVLRPVIGLADPIFQYQPIESGKRQLGAPLNGQGPVPEPVSQVPGVPKGGVAACPSCGEQEVAAKDGCCFPCGLPLIRYADRDSFELAATLRANAREDYQRVVREKDKAQKQAGEWSALLSSGGQGPVRVIRGRLDGGSMAFVNDDGDPVPAAVSVITSDNQVSGVRLGSRATVLIYPFGPPK